MRSKRSFLKYKNNCKYLVYNYKQKAHKAYQFKNTNNFKLVGLNFNKIEEPIFFNVLKIAKSFKKLGFFYTKAISLNLKLTSKPLGIRMGKGKGKITHKMALIKNNQSLMNFREINTNNLSLIYKKLKHKISSKLNLTIIKDSF